VLLPTLVLLRRVDLVVVIGAALVARHVERRTRAEVSRAAGAPWDTVRGWLRRFAGRAGQVREAFTRAAAALSPDPVPLEPAGSPLADAVVAVAATAAAVAARWPELPAVSAWQVAVAVTNASLLSPVMTAGGFHTSSLS
jgi:hypothetical protein